MVMQINLVVFVSYFLGPLAALHLLSLTPSYHKMLVTRARVGRKNMEVGLLDAAYEELSFFSSLLCLERLPPGYYGLPSP